MLLFMKRATIMGVNTQSFIYIYMYMYIHVYMNFTAFFLYTGIYNSSKTPLRFLHWKFLVTSLMENSFEWTLQKLEQCPSVLHNVYLCKNGLGETSTEYM